MCPALVVLQLDGKAGNQHSLRAPAIALSLAIVERISMILVVLRMGDSVDGMNCRSPLESRNKTQSLTVSAGNSDKVGRLLALVSSESKTLM